MDVVAKAERIISNETTNEQQDFRHQLYCLVHLHCALLAS